MSLPNAEHWVVFCYCPLLISPRGTTQEVQAPEAFSASQDYTYVLLSRATDIHTAMVHLMFYTPLPPVTVPHAIGTSF